MLFGRFVVEGSNFTPGLKSMFWKLVSGRQLNTLSNYDLRFLHLLLCKMYEFTLNCYMLKDAMGNCGTGDSVILGRKVPLEYWKLLYDVCCKCGMKPTEMANEGAAAQLWARMTQEPLLLKELLRQFFLHIGLTQPVSIRPCNMFDVNLLFNLGGALPCRLLMVLMYCLKNWGKQECEPWVRHFCLKIFVLYLLITGSIVPKRELLDSCVRDSYAGILETITQDILVTYGASYIPRAPNRHHASLDLVHAFNNNILFF
ncbi:hypothetical protein RHVP.18 [Cricetid gammaherpesvirus 2]|uniref:Protein UL79 n=1 Tax=Cricetid gammaherpesvirus 2 TaxID=1605972 RepID=E9M5K1_9GAMA|nr:hypothetical protein RHVP.18 [Cricetid gammaherpesvirus 2]ADW24359.1 hypothetical protein RHVP.18 [Cricetid gammaherpesvirus 2]ADW24441.1 hypothetical protein RHVP-L.18 [Cricetid gammaherpesvirus 2]